MRNRQRRHNINRDDSPFDRNGLLKDGRTYRVPVSMRDHRTVNDARVTTLDGRGNLARPGYRTLADSAARAAAANTKNRAYAEYERQLTDAWRGSDAEGYSEANLGGVCTVQGADYPLDYGAPGHIKRVNGKICCVPDNPVSGRPNPPTASDARRADYDLAALTDPDDDDEEDRDEEDRDDDDDDDDDARATSDARSIAQRIKAHQRTMNAIHDQMDAALREAWREGK